MNLAAWLMGMITPMAVRVLIGLGFCAVSFSGVQVGVNSLIASAQSNWSALPLTVLQLSSLSGIPEALGMIAAAYTARIAVWMTINGTKYIVKT